MKLDYFNCKRCGNEVRRKRLAQVYCGRQCSDAAKKARKLEVGTECAPLPPY